MLRDTFTAEWGTLFKGKPSWRYGCMDQCVVDIDGTDESETEQIIDYTVHLIQQE